jgi:3-hydroxyisobutyrate dehydrogenase-like beta-hydroxyacid dehydrogenase
MFRVTGQLWRETHPVRESPILRDPICVSAITPRSFPPSYMAKDLRLALESAADLSVSLEQTGHLNKIYGQGMSAGWADDDFIGLMRLLDKKP